MRNDVEKNKILNPHKKAWQNNLNSSAKYIASLVQTCALPFWKKARNAWYMTTDNYVK